MYSKSILLAALLLLVQHNVRAETRAPKTIACSHAMVCELVRSMIQGLEGYELKRLTLAPEDQNQLIAAEIYVAPPVDLQPKSESIVAKRETGLRKNIKLYLPSHLSKLFKYGNHLPAAELSQFWLYPSITCHLHQQAQSFLLEKTSLSKEVECPVKDQQTGLFALFRKLKEKSDACQLQLHNPAFAPYLERLGIAYSREKDAQAPPKAAITCAEGKTVLPVLNIDEATAWPLPEIISFIHKHLATFQSE